MSERAGADLGLYSVTFNNRLDEDLADARRVRRFRDSRPKPRASAISSKCSTPTRRRLDAANLPQLHQRRDRPHLGRRGPGRPAGFLKIVYHGPQAMEELVAYDPHLIVGILGGAAGHDLRRVQADRRSAKIRRRAALFGRKINQAENQLAFVEFLRLIVDGVISPEDAVRAYHSVLAKLSIKPHRSLADDLELRTAVMSYGGGGTVTVPSGVPGAAKKKDCGCGCGGKKKEEPAAGPCGCSGKNEAAKPTPAAIVEPDFAQMSQAEKLAYNQRGRNRIFG